MARGLWAYRWQNIYYTTYNHSDSDPSGLGSDLVAKIPTDAAEFAQWVTALQNELVHRSDGETTAPEPRGLFAWIYIIDLDRNVFTINDNTHIRLDKIPRSQDRSGWTVASNRSHPSNVDLPSSIAPSAEYLALYDAIQASLSSTITPPTHFAFGTCAVLMEQLFHNFCFVYNPRSWAKRADIPQFFTVARGIVALATWGDFDLISQLLTYNHTERSDIEPEWTGESRMSTPTHFWHRGVLFVLESGPQTNAQLRSAVGRVVHIWRRCRDIRKRRAVAFVMTLLDVVQVDLSDGSVKHSAPVPLVSRDMLEPCEDDYSARRSGFPHLRKPAPSSPGFAMLKAILTPELPPSSLSAKLPFPVDLVERLLDWCDADTVYALGVTCKSIRSLWLHRPRLAVGPYRLLHSVGDGVFTALDPYGDTVSVCVGGLRFDEYDTEGGCGYNLRLFVRNHRGRQRRNGFATKIIGLSCRPYERGDEECVAP
ncbi:hypothetical protein EXIGLDRAFT_744231 [Exidia glandulosa HHB12029]|uniref:F-box domain-containing protein n=1 Tax=Exidia glandulosa HHB12029 TaxID=1314781 RepID=A0A165Q3R9_EXIGL|nr:hypothetical protein EXIGLDRAFT_744231 [Exidia glandulosa HHB12029]